MTCDPWFQAFLILPPRICGIDLLPFSVAHDYILGERGNPYAWPSDQKKPAKEADLLEAVQICGRTWEQNRAFLLGCEKGEWLEALAQWSYKWHRKMDFPTADASLRTYLDDYRMVAKHRPRKSSADSTEIAAPSHWHLVGCLMRHRGMTESQAWNCAFNSAHCHFDTWTESNGDDSLVSAWEAMTDVMALEAEALDAAGQHDEAAAKYSELQDLCDERRKARAG